MQVNYEETIEQELLTLKRIRLLISLGIILITLFMFADLPLIPKSLAKEYIVSRVYIQIPLCILFFISTFHPLFFTHYQKILFIVMLAVIYTNYWFIMTAWQQAQFTFSYEGTLLYTLFTLIIFKQSFRYALFFTIIVSLGFINLCTLFPIYGDQTFTNCGFVSMASLVALIGVKQVESALKKLSTANSNLEKLNETDYLTGIYNRRTYESLFTELVNLEQRNHFSIAVFMIDIDYFKDYNDGYGHIEGDKIIQLQASNLTKIFKRSSDIIARYGGEEFVVVTSQLNQTQCITLANQLIKQWAFIKVEHNKGKAASYVSCSIGFYLTEVEQYITKTQMVKYADDALYQAKRSGRNCFVQYKEMNEQG